MMSNRFLQSHGSKLMLASILLVSIVRVAATYAVFNHTVDEPTHISCGLEWLERHTYTYEYQHPPLSRVLAGIGPWLLGAPNIESKELLPSKNPLVLYDSASYYQSLTAARVGQLPFLVLAGLVVYFWARELFGKWPAAFSVLLFTTIPVVLGHAGLATTDASVMATLPWALYALNRLLRNACIGNSALFGIALGFGVLSKFSFLLFFAAGAMVILAEAWFTKGERRLPGVWTWTGAALLAFFVIWSGYLWNVGEVPLVDRPGGFLSLLPQSLLSAMGTNGVVRLPLSELYLGIVEVREHNLDGHRTFLLGETSMTGWWYFFPVVFFYKTPIAFLLLVCGMPLVSKGQHWRGLVPLLCAVALMAVAMPSRINLGIRHLLPIYPLLAIGAGLVVFEMVRAKRIALQVLGITLLGWQIGASGMAHPDYIAYFNEFAGEDVEEIRVDSDLDWGQNVDRLAREIRKRGIASEVGLALFSSVDPSRHGLNWYPLSPWKASTGWVAVSATEKMLSDASASAGELRRPWAWLDAHQPVMRVGRSILLYYIEPVGAVK